MLVVTLSSYEGHPNHDFRGVLGIRGTLGEIEGLIKEEVARLGKDGRHELILSDQPKPDDLHYQYMFDVYDKDGEPVKNWWAYIRYRKRR